MILKIIVMFISLVLSALFSGTEIVYSKVNVNRLERTNSKKALKAKKIADNFSNTITTILIGNNLVNVLMSSVAAILALDIAEVTSLTEDEISIIMTIGITLIVLIFGEILPKTIFQLYTYQLSLQLTSFITFFNYLFKPLSVFFEWLVKQICKLFKKYAVEDNEDAEDDAQEALMNMAEDLEDKGVIDEEDAELIKSAIDLSDKTAWEIMIPRVDVIAYNKEDTLEEMMEDENFFINSRVLLYEETIDHIIGIIDTVKVLKKKLNNEEVVLDDVLYEPLYVHKTMPIANVLKELKSTHKHLAIVLDEWGGTYGILTMEDILEELFGDIWDETDTVEKEYSKLDDKNYIVNADMGLSDFFDLIDYDDKDFDSDYSTVGGLFTELIDDLPEKNDEVDFENYHLKVIQTDDFRVLKIKVTINEIEEEID